MADTYLSPEDFRAFVASLPRRRLAAGALVRRRVCLADGLATLEDSDQPQGLQMAGGCVTQTFGPGWRMLLIGAGQLAEYLATMALFNGFAVTVCDPREPHRATWRVDGVRLVHEMPDDAVLAFRPDRRSADRSAPTSGWASRRVRPSH